MVALQLCFYYLAAFLVLCYVGYAPARLLLRGDLRAYLLPFMPLLGLCTVIVASSFLNGTALPMTSATWVILAGASVANLGLAFRTKGLHLPRPSKRDAALWALMLIAYILGIAPLIHANTTAFLGNQWDIEIYLPLTEYLKRYAIGGSIQAISNPLIESLNTPAVRGGSGWGFSYLEAFLGTLVDWPSFQSFRPTLQLVFSLSVPAVYLFGRVGLGIGNGAALVAAALAGVNGLNLWLASIGLGGHAVTLLALPLALATTRVALKETSRSSVLLAGLVVATMLLSFYTGALMLYGIAIGFLGLTWLVLGPSRRQLLLATGGIAASTLLFGLVAHLRFLEVLPFYFRDGPSEGWHVPEFSPLGIGLGFIPFSLVTERLGDAAQEWMSLPPEGIALWSSVLTLGAVALCLIALMRKGWERESFLVFLAAFAIFGAYLRWRADYPYGYFKLLSLTSFLLLCGIAQGVSVLWRWTDSWSKEAVLERTGGLAQRLFEKVRPFSAAATSSGALSIDRARSPRWPTIILRGMVAAYGMLLLPLLIANTAQSVRFFWEPDPQELPRSVWELQALHSIVPPGAPVSLTGRSNYNPKVAAMLSYFLIDNPLIGNFKTSYGQAKSSHPDEYYEYLLLQPGERPEERGLRASDRVWQNDLVALYRRPQRWLTSVDLESTAETLPLASQERLALSLKAEGWSLTDGREQFTGSYTRQANRQQVELTILTFGNTTASLRSGQGEELVNLPAGMVSYRTAPVAAPTTLELSLQGTERPARLLGLRVLNLEDAAPQLLLSQDILLLQPRFELREQRAELNVDYRFADSRGGYVSLSVEAYRRTPPGRTLQPGASWRLAYGKGEAGAQEKFILDVAGWNCGTSSNAVHSAGPLAPRDGVYDVYVAGYYVNEELIRWLWLTFVISDGKVATLHQWQNPSYTVLYLPKPQDVRALEQALPAGAQVYVPPLTDPDNSFIPVAVTLLADRGFFADSPQYLPGSRLAAPGVAYPYVLLPAGEDPGQWGLGEAARLWANEAAALYRRSPGSPLAHYRFASDSPWAALTPHQTLQALVDKDKVTLASPAGHAGITAAYPVPADVLQGRILGFANGPTTITVDTGGATEQLELVPGRFEYWMQPLAVARGNRLSISSSGPGTLRLTDLEVVRPTAEPGGLRQSANEAYVEAASYVEGNVAHVKLQYWGYRPEDTVVGLDVYGERLCNLEHYGWWATPLKGLPDTIELVLDLSHQQGKMQSSTGTALATGSETWPVSDGTFRAFILRKHGETFDTVPAFEFTLEGSRVTAFRALPVARALSLSR